MARDYLFIDGLAVDCLIGFADWERLVKQTVILDLKLGVDLVGPVVEDRIPDGGLNTKALSKRLQTFVGQSEYRLIETLADRVARLVLEEFPVRWVELRLSKPRALRGADNVGVVILRGKSE